MSKSFTSPPKKDPIRFDVDGEEFEAAPTPPGGALLDIISLATGSNTERARAIGEFLDATLMAESQVRFAARLRSAENPITLETASQVMAWLMGEYTGRPTAPSSSTPNGREPVGVSSTAGAPPEE